MIAARALHLVAGNVRSLAWRPLALSPCSRRVLCSVGCCSRFRYSPNNDLGDASVAEPQGPHTARRRDPVQQPAVDPLRRPVPNRHPPQPVYLLHVLLRLRLHRHEAYRRPRQRPRDRLAVLVRLHARLHELRTHQQHPVPVPRCPMVRGPADFHRHPRRPPASPQPRFGIRRCRGMWSSSFRPLSPWCPRTPRTRITAQSSNPPTTHPLQGVEAD